MHCKSRHFSPWAIAEQGERLLDCQTQTPNWFLSSLPAAERMMAASRILTLGRSILE